MQQLRTFEIKESPASIEEASRAGVLPERLNDPLRAIVADIALLAAQRPLSIYLCSSDDDRRARDYFGHVLTRALGERLPDCLMVDCDFLSVGLSGIVPLKDGMGFLDLLLYGSSLGAISQKADGGVTVVGAGSFPVARKSPFMMDAFQSATRYLLSQARCVIYCGPCIDDKESVHPITECVSLPIVLGVGSRRLPSLPDVMEDKVSSIRDSEVWSIRLGYEEAPLLADTESPESVDALDEEFVETAKGVLDGWGVSQPADEEATRTPVDEVTAGTPADEVTAGMPADEVTAGTPADEVTAGTPADEVTAGTPADEVAAGTKAEAESVFEPEPAETKKEEEPIDAGTARLGTVSQVRIAERRGSSALPKVVTTVLAVSLIGFFLWWLYLTKSIHDLEEPPAPLRPTAAQKTSDEPADVPAGQPADTLQAQAQAKEPATSQDVASSPDAGGQPAATKTEAKPVEITPDEPPPAAAHTLRPSGEAVKATVSVAESIVQYAGRYVLHVSSFRSMENARVDAEYLADRGHAAIIVPVNLGERGRWYRVYVGPVESQTDATDLKKSLDEYPRVKSTRITRVPG